MRGGFKENKGFTLSELLVSIALTAILVLLAVPLVLSMQNNMRLAELNSAAESIAQATQSKMTFLKTSGTWFSTLEKAGLDDDSQRARHLPPGKNSDTIYYLTADQARDSNIISSGSLEEHIYQGDFIIEFNRSTASVSGVFYTDGKQGFFGEQPSMDENNYAQSYYLSMNSSSARDQEARREASPLIGYSWNTPSGATQTVALQNPIIYADKNGNLCIQNKNLRQTSLNTSLEVVITRVNDDGSESPAFILSGLQVFSNQILAYEITTQERLDSSQSGLLIAAGEGIELISRDGSSNTDVFCIDLNTISDLVRYNNAGASDIEAILASFGPATNIRVDTTVSTTQVPCVPASTTGYLQWPERVVSLSILITDPSNLKLDDSYEGTHIQEDLYTNPAVELGFTDGSSSTDSSYISKIGTTFDLPSTTAVLTSANPASAYQAYSGGLFNLKDIDASISTLNASLGSYGQHRYQTFELWLNDTQVGYLQKNTWTWTPGIGEAFGTCVNNLGTGDGTLTLETLHIDVRAFQNLIASGTIARSDGDYIVYIRTTPRIDEVNSYFTDQVNNAGSIHNLTEGSVGARNGSAAQSTGIRTSFESEFGAPSSSSLWVVARETTTSGISGFPFGGNNDFRVYYAGTPALGFSTYDSSSLRDANGVRVTEYETSELHNATLWYYQQSGSGYVAHPQAMVIDPDRAGIDPLWLTTVAASDFEIPSSRDFLFTRALFYNNENGGLINTQYVPYSVQGEAAYATIANRPYDKTGYTFNWITPSTYPGGTTLALAERSLVGSYDGQLSYGRIDVNATFTNAENSMGLVYYEVYSDGTMGVYGYTSYGSSLINTLRGNDIPITNWGYYVIVSQAITEQYNQIRQGGRNGSQLNLATSSFMINGVRYSAYSLEIADKTQSYRNIEFWLGKGNDTIGTSYFSFNVNFARMVEKDQPTVAQWGTDTYPFYVRHPDHFIGTMSAGTLQSAYVGEVFHQTHDVDLAGRTVFYGSSTFTGLYDGGSTLGCVIKNYEPKTANNQGNSVGLFGLMNGSTLQNIIIDYTEKSGSFTHNFTSGSNFAFGFLASVAENDAKLINCSVNALKSNGDHLEMNISNPNSLQLSVGGLVGRVNNAVFTDCKVTGIDIKITSSLGASSANIQAIGGITGYVEGAKTKFERSEPDSPSDPPRKSVTDFSITGATNQTLTNATIYYGAVVGYKASNATAVSLDDTWFSSTIIKRTISGNVYSFVEAIGRIPTSTDPVG